MDNVHKSFLNELSGLCTRYGIEQINTDDSERIRFEFKDGHTELRFKNYTNDVKWFNDVISIDSRYEVELDTY
ncbi:hypothetical protein RASY3_14670 [Ruminococcus albus SY3]|uniref:Uncharacterized protein n=1 Tax=Ruminococcus albus SY3 TaxID=1341156 RepID=A0A011VVG3_RUMAL|nr:hypothetical protein RASY3_14670 [Ruminococcus albus SY3]